MEISLQSIPHERYQNAAMDYLSEFESQFYSDVRSKEQKQEDRERKRNGDGPTR